MKVKTLRETLRLVTKVCSDPRMSSDQRDQLQKAKRELETVARSGKLDGSKVFLAVETISAVLLDVVENEVTRR